MLRSVESRKASSGSSLYAPPFRVRVRVRVRARIRVGVRVRARVRVRFG